MIIKFLKYVLKARKLNRYIRNKNIKGALSYINKLKNKKNMEDWLILSLIVEYEYYFDNVEYSYEIFKKLVLKLLEECENSKISKTELILVIKHYIDKYNFEYPEIGRYITDDDMANAEGYKDVRILFRARYTISDIHPKKYGDKSR